MGRGARRHSSSGFLRTGVIALAVAVCAAPAFADSLSAKDLQIMTKSLGFLEPPSSSGVIAVVYAGNDASSKSDADGIVANFGSGLKAGANDMTATSVAATALGDGSSYVAIIIAAGAPTDGAMAIAKARHIPCMTGVVALVQSGTCIMAVMSQPKVSIIVNHAAAEAAGITFAQAFRMLIKEI
jgi:hypothetical protein